MEVEIRIGRDVSGAGAHKVPATYTFVGRNHASIHWRDGIVTIEDNSSTNGTYVNGKRVSRAIIKENDSVWLGGCGTDSRCYHLDLKYIFASFPKTATINTATPTPIQSPLPPRSKYGDDYAGDFAHIKQAYIDYHKELSKLNKKANNKMLVPRILISTVPALLGIAVMIISKDMTMRIIAMSAGSVLSVVLGTLTMGRGSSSKDKLTEKILDLQIKYQKEYRCPKCGKEYSLDLHWKKLQADGKCPYGCGAHF